jgi:oxygen-dependent protoporphyrinogen oxidase
LKDRAPELATLLAKVQYNSLASVPLGLRTKELPQGLNGFGFLAARQSGLRTLGSIWNSAAFRKRAPEGFFLMTNFIGGTHDPTAVELPDAELTRTVLRDLETVFKRKLDAKPLPITRYRSAIPHMRLVTFV